MVWAYGTVINYGDDPYSVSYTEATLKRCS